MCTPLWEYNALEGIIGQYYGTSTHFKLCLDFGRLNLPVPDKEELAPTSMLKILGEVLTTVKE